ncbi:MAG: hypothetical protein JSU95_02800 [Betaproteobacteria bacterium]|nr:MAG: hypothetical protein JSU95_02800 [Betaproteobacteria bacterium]
MTMRFIVAVFVGLLYGLMPAASASAQSELAQSELAQSELAQSELAQSEQAQSELAQSEQAQSESVQSESVQSESAQSEQPQGEAESDSEQSEGQRAQNESIAETVSPARIKPRFFIRNEFRQRKDGTHINITEPLYDLPLTDKLGLRIQVPYVVNNPPDEPSVNGLGDITTVFFYRYLRSASGSYFLSLDTRWNTAANRKTGVGNTLVAPGWFASINLPKYDTILFPAVQSFVSVDKDEDREEINYTVLKLRFLTKLENRFYTFVEPLIYFDHEDDEYDSTGTLEVEIGRFANKQTMIYARPGVGLWGNTGSPYLFEWNFEIGYRYFFK